MTDSDSSNASHVQRIAADNPFTFGGKITDPARFVGRADESRFIFQRMAGAQMTSVGIVGERRIGKSSLLYHIYQTYPERLNEPAHFALAYVSLQDARVRTQAGCVQTIAAELSRACQRHPNAAVLPAWPVPCLDMVTLRRGVGLMHEAGLRCVLCLDEFEAFLELPQQFDNAFFDALRAMMDDQLLMLILASARPLNEYGGRYRQVSRFFNLGNTLFLKEFAKPEARLLVAHPVGSDGPPALGVTDQELALKLGGWHPFYLQMAAHYVFEAAQTAKDAAWVRQQYERQAAQTPRQGRPARWLLRITRIPSWAGRAAVWVGQRQDEVRNSIVGAAIIVVIVLSLLGVIPVQEIFRQIGWALGLSGGQP